MTKLAGFEYTKYIANNLCNDGIPLFKGKNVQDGKIIYEFESYIPLDISNELSRSQITRKCLLTPYVGTIGNIGIHSKEGIFHLGSNVGKIELYNQSEVLLEEYVVAYMKSTYGYKELTKHIKATAQASISIDAIRDVYIAIPPSNEQKRIAQKVDEILSFVAIIDNLRIEIDDIKALLKSRILELAIQGKLVPQDENDEPASVLLERIRAERKAKLDKKYIESYIFKGDDNYYYEKVGNTSKKISEEMPFDLPFGWCWITLKEIATITSGKTPKNEQITDLGNIPYFKVGDMNLSGNEIFMEVVQYYVNDCYTGITFPKNSFIFPKNGGALLTNKKRILKQESLVDLNTGVLIPSSAVNNEFMFYLFSTVDFTKNYKGSTIPTIDNEMIGNIVFALPPIEEQSRIVKKIKAIMSILKGGD